MPRAAFYQGLPLAEQLEKFIEHHHDSAVRHISQDEAAILDEAVSRLKSGYPDQSRRNEFREIWNALEHSYETIIWSSAIDFTLTATSVPGRGASSPESLAEVVPTEWVLAEARATPRLVQLALNIVFRCAIDDDADVARLWEAGELRRSPPVDSKLAPIAHEKS